MTSANLSLADKLKNRKKYLSRTLWTSYVAMLLFALYQILGVILMVSRSSNYSRLYNDSYEIAKLGKCRAVLSVLGPCQFGFIIVIAVAVMFAFQGFSYVFNQSKMDFYLSQPTTRGQRIRRNYIDAICTFLLIYVLSEVVALFVAICMGAFNMSVLVAVLLETLRSLVLFFTVYNMTVLAIMLTGTFPIAVMLTIFFGVVSIIIGGEIRLLKSIFFETYSSMEAFNIYLSPVFDRFMGFFNVYHFFEGSNNYGRTVSSILTAFRLNLTYDIDTLIVGIIAIVAMLGFSKKRKAEKAGSSFAFRSFRWFMKVIVSSIVGIGSCYFVYLIYEDVWNDKLYFMMAFIMIIATVMTGCICEVIFENNIKRVFKGLCQTIMAVAIVLLTFLIFRGDLVGYDTYVPKASSLESCAFASQIENYSIRAYITNEDFRMIDMTSFENYSDENMEIKDFDSFLKLAAIGMKTQKEADDESYHDDGWNAVVLYRLKGGREVYRRIIIPYDIDPELMDSIVGSKEYIEGTFPVFGDESIREYAKTVNVSAYFTTVKNRTDIAGVSYEEFSDAYRKDVLDNYSFSFAMNSNSSYIGTLYLSSNGSGYIDVTVPVYKEYKNTIALLKKYNIYSDEPLSADDVEKLIVRNYYPGYDEVTDDIYSLSDYPDVVTHEYTDKEQIAKILECAVDTASYGSGSWANYNKYSGQYSVEVILKNASDYYNNRSYTFEKGNVPEFVIQDTNQ